MSENEFDRITWKRGMEVKVSMTGAIRNLVGINFEYRTVLLADHRNRQEWYFFYQVEIV